MRKAACPPRWIFGFLLCAGLAVWAGAQGAPSALSADVTFRCLWWSEGEMVGLNPNAPPPKTTEVVIRKWEYTDPIGVPNPDTLDVVVDLANNGTTTLEPGAIIEIAAQWLDGPKKSKGAAKWSALKPVGAPQTTPPIGPQQHALVRTSVDLKGRMADLDKKGLWPWALRAIITVRSASGGKPILTRQAELPINRGD